MKPNNPFISMTTTNFFYQTMDGQKWGRYLLHTLVCSPQAIVKRPCPSRRPSRHNQSFFHPAFMPINHFFFLRHVAHVERWRHLKLFDYIECIILPLSASEDPTEAVTAPCPAIPVTKFGNEKERNKKIVDLNGRDELKWLKRMSTILERET